MVQPAPNITSQSIYILDALMAERPNLNSNVSFVGRSGMSPFGSASGLADIPAATACVSFKPQSPPISLFEATPEI